MKSYMTEELSIFSKENLGSLQSLTSEDGELWFTGKSVADILKIKNPQKVYKTLEPDEKKVIVLLANNSNVRSGIQAHRMTIVSESGLYGMIMASRKKEAREFQRWVTHDVLPSIRRSGGYIMGQEKLPQKEREELEEKIRSLTEKNAQLKEKKKELTKSNERLQARRHELIKDNKELKSTAKHMKGELGKMDELLDIYEKLTDRQNSDYEELWYENQRLKERLSDAGSSGAGSTAKKDDSHEYFVMPDGTIYSTRADAIKERQGR